MKMHPCSLLLAILGLGLFSPTLLHGASPQLSATRLDFLDERGYFTPAFKTAIHDLVNAREALAQAKAEQEKMKAMLPDLQKQGEDAVARVADLQKELNRYAHPEDADFDALQKAMGDPAAKPQDRLVLAQAFVWSYPTDPHQPEAEQDLQRIQKQLSDEVQAAKDADVARVAARAKLVQRAEARNLSLSEWQGFLQDMSQEDLLTYLGRPQTQGIDYWIYSGVWTTDPSTQAKVGLQIQFNGGRVIRVVGVAP